MTSYVERLHDRRLYGAEDEIQLDLLNEVSRHVLYNELPSLAAYLKMTEPEYQYTVVRTDPPKVQARKVLELWSNNLLSLAGTNTVRHLIGQLQIWQQRGYVDRGVWSGLKSYVISDLLLKVEKTTPPTGMKSRPLVPSAAAGVGSKPPAPCGSGGGGKVGVDWWIKYARDSTPDSGSTDTNKPSISDLKRIQALTKRSVERKCRNAMTLDWLSPEKAKSFPLKKYYVGLKWTRLVKGVLSDTSTDLDNIYSVVKKPESGATYTAQNFLIEGEPGIGKTTSMALLALNWATTEPQLKHFHYVFLVQLRYVDKTSSLADLVIAQHDQLESNKIPSEHIRYILEGKTYQNVLLLLDGYDEYQTGTNQEIDSAIKSTIGNCFLLLTSRTDKSVGKEIRDMMDAELKIEGLSHSNVYKCAEQYLDSKDKSVDMLMTSRLVGLFELLHIPILLLMLCVIFHEYGNLPRKLTEILTIIFQLIMDRSTLKHLGVKSKAVQNIAELLDVLGEFAWKALISDTEQLLLNKEELEKRAPGVMKLGLLYETGIDVATVRERPVFVSFLHKLLQEYAAACYIARRLKDQTKAMLVEFFPTQERLEKQEQVVMFTLGLMENPTALIEHIYQVFADEIGQSINSDDVKVNLSIPYGGAIIREYPRYLNNAGINYFRETCSQPIRTLSKIYWFKLLREEVKWEVHQSSLPEKMRECVIYIDSVEPIWACNVLRICYNICRYQRIKYLSVAGLQPDQIGWYFSHRDTFLLSPKAKIITVLACTPPHDVMLHVIEQLGTCTELQALILKYFARGLSGRIFTAQLPQPPAQGYSNLVEMDLSDNPCAMGLLKTTFRCPLPSLSHLDLGGVDMTEDDLIEIAKIVSNGKNMRRLVFPNNRMSHMEPELDYVMEAVLSKKVFSLYISKTSVSPAFKKKWRERVKECRPGVAISFH